MSTIDFIKTSLRTADDWHKKEQLTWVSKCLSSALMGYLQIAVKEQADITSGVEWLKAQGFLAVLKRYWETLKGLGDEVSAGCLPSSVIGGNYCPLVFAHAAWCLDAFSLGESFVAFAERRDVGELSTSFWREYARGMGALLRREIYHPSILRLRGQEKYWIVYLRLAESVCNNHTMETAVNEMEKSFAIRNRDKTIQDDAFQIEGAGGGPVKWDFRGNSLLKLVAHRKLAMLADT